MRENKVQVTLKNKNASEESEAEAHLDDSKLVSDGLQGDRDAFEILFFRYRPILYRLAQRILRNHEESEDAVQNCSLAAFRKMKTFKYEGAFRSWLARILVNEAITILRKRRRAAECSIPQERVETAGSLPDPSPNPEQILSRKQSAGALMRKLSQLSPGQRAVLLLCEIYEYNHRRSRCDSASATGRDSFKIVSSAKAVGFDATARTISERAATVAIVCCILERQSCIIRPKISLTPDEFMGTLPTAICGKFGDQIKLRGSGGWPTPWMLAPAGVDKRVLKPE